MNNPSMMRTLFFLILYFSCLIIFKGCKTTEPILTGRSVEIEVVGSSPTEVWLKLTAKPQDNIILKRNDKETINIHLTTSDSLITDDSLLPNNIYHYQAISNNAAEVSEKVTTSTMDTTSHNFRVESWSFGEHSSSRFNDVAIIDENNIWAVGAVYMNDSTGVPDPFVYNAAHWDGVKWTLKKIAVDYAGLSTIAILNGIFILPTNQIILSSGIPYLPNGNEWQLFHLWDMGILNKDDGEVNRIWGTDINNLYFAGEKGTIVHYDGKSWHKLESGTKTDLSDICGVIDNKTGAQSVICSVSNPIEPGEYKIISLNKQNKAGEIEWVKNKRIHSIWMKNRQKMFACGDGVFINNSKEGWKEQNINFVYSERVRGSDLNDIFVVGDFGLIAHFNGISWKEYPEAASALVYSSIAIKGDLIVVVGYTYSQAVIQFMRRN